MNTETIKQQWFGNVKNDVLSGMVVAMALIPEAIAFSIIAGVDPMVGLYASFCIAVVIAFMGGRPGMISAATGAMALLMVTLVRDHGLEYLLAATILTGILQFVLGALKIGQFMKFIPRSVMIGFVNALGILIFTSQLTHFEGAGMAMYIMVAGSLAIIYILPRFTKAVPAPLVAIVLMTIIAITTGTGLKTVGDMGELSSTLPIFLIPDIPLTFETLQIIFPISLALAFVGLLESLLTAQIVDDMTDTVSDKNKEARGQGVANVVSGFFGGMAGCAMIGQSVINVTSGGRGRLSTLVAGIFMMLLIIVFNDLLVQIPMAVLVGVMIMVSIGTFDWSSLTKFHKTPISDSVVMVVTVGTVVKTHDLSKGVLAGVILSAIFFVAKISKVKVEEVYDESTKKMVYYVSGQVFFASTDNLMKHFDYTVNADKVEINFSDSHVWDDSAVAAIDKLVLKYREYGKDVEIVGLNKDSSQLVQKLAVHNKTNATLSNH
ncbi:sulfate permease, SulP family [Halobacillus karajensis]|uniref:Bicarbonate transporter BicA n=1 Tax=Halobacillus karajensis TaxID=195088 RepID=A0A059NZ64_9BACI|nr:SulP family inorganic anion transporter [Halobacillus karajensis]CDQ21155.1 Bicarbonate transporter BicA [Halobacillus karajensis]CDQ24781.1 Bicarbonate transporter BicA [Halobacillus karajensis]CDQ28859.1 Bicarbonate transporter BicA [Halobacillus karajensis]SEH95554.1 sulfate permease, SulP family [Halobacillus karajensis]